MPDNEPSADDETPVPDERDSGESDRDTPDTEPAGRVRRSDQIRGALAGLVLIVGLLAGLWVLISGRDGVATPEGDDATAANDVAPGEEEAADLADRQPANPSGAADPEVESVTMGTGDWVEAGFVGAIAAELLTELDYEVIESQPMGPDQAFGALASGQLDIWADAWMPVHEPYLDVDDGQGGQVGDAVEIAGTATEAGGVMGIFITTAWANDNGVETVEDVLGHPDAGTLFDLTGDDVPDFFGCDPTWPCAETINNVIRERNWLISQYAGDYDASVQSAIARADSGEPAMIFTWLPSVHGDALGIADGRFSLLGVADPGADKAATSTPCLADPCVPGFAVDDLVIAANRTFLTEHGDVAAVLAQITVPQSDTSAALGTADEEGLKKQAAAWIASHRDEVERWIDAAG